MQHAFEETSETNVPEEFPVVYLSSSGNHPEPWSAVYFISEHLPSASEVKHITLKVNMLPTVIFFSSITITYTGE